MVVGVVADEVVQVAVLAAVPVAGAAGGAVGGGGRGHAGEAGGVAEAQGAGRNAGAEVGHVCDIGCSACCIGDDDSSVHLLWPQQAQQYHNCYNGFCIHLLLCE